MNDMVKMVVVLTVLSAVSGGLLAAVRDNTAERIENQQLIFVKGPAIKSILKDASNDPIKDRFKLKDGDQERTFFVGVINGKASAVAFETSAGGFGGPVGLMVGIDVSEGKFLGVGVTTHSETPGVGARSKTDPSFVAQFAGLEVANPLKVSADGGQINALSGATITSRAVCAAATEAEEIFKRVKPQLEEKMKAFK